MTTFLEAQDAALHDDFDATKYRTWAKRFLNEAVGLIYRSTSLALGDQTFPITLNAGDAFQDFADAGIVIESITRSDTGQEIAYLSRAEFEQLSNELGSRTGPPVYYTITGTGTPEDTDTRIAVLPIADGSYVLDAVARSAAMTMTQDSDPVPLPETYALYPVRYARSKLFALEDDEQMSAFWNAEWLGALQAIKSDLSRRRIGVRQTPSMWANADTGPRFHHPQGLF